MNEIDSKKFGFSVFMSARMRVNSLENGALVHGGATKLLGSDEIYSNIKHDDFIKVYGRNNKLSLFVPDTINVDSKVNPEEYIKMTLSMLKGCDYDNAFLRKGVGTWYSEDRNEVVYDNLRIVSVLMDDVTETDIQAFIEVARVLKQLMKQEAITITVNDALCLI